MFNSSISHSRYHLQIEGQLQLSAPNQDIGPFGAITVFTDNLLQHCVKKLKIVKGVFINQTSFMK